jgi:ATP-dependent RNA helicase DDX24/MAK5
MSSESLKQFVQSRFFYCINLRFSQGSGKTLAYGLPILHYLLSQPQPTHGKKRHVRALILAPTRELALQVSSHLNACLSPVEPSKSEPSTVQKDAKKGEGKRQGKAKGTESDEAGGVVASQKPPPHVSVAAIVGGMSAQKQRRILNRGVDVLVATPGRLWDIMEEVCACQFSFFFFCQLALQDDSLSSEINNLSFLVLDEADRMIESGHFAELENILRLTLRANKCADLIRPINDLSLTPK